MDRETLKLFIFPFIEKNQIIHLINSIIDERYSISIEDLRNITPFLNPNHIEDWKNRTTVPNFMDKYVEISARLWHLYNDLDFQQCPVCKNKSKFYIKFSKGYAETCRNQECIVYHQNQSRKKTSNERYGSDFPWQTNEIKQKMVDSYAKEYGNDPIKKKQRKDRKIKTNLERYGVEHPTQLKETMDKVKQHYIDNYGVTHQMHLESTKEKIRKTSLLKYGADHYMKNAQEFNKNFKAAHRWKDYTLPSGKIIKIQGYENFALDKLLKTHDESDIIVENVEIESRIGKIIYDHPTTKTKCRYYPDIYIESEKKIIEVKSDYTLKMNVKINECKRLACINLGLSFEYWVVNSSSKEIKPLQ